MTGPQNDTKRDEPTDKNIAGKINPLVTFFYTILDDVQKLKPERLDDLLKEYNTEPEKVKNS